MDAYVSMNAGRVKRMYGSEYVSVVSRKSLRRKRAFQAYPPGIKRASLFLSSARMLINNCQFVGGARRNRKTVRYRGVTRREG